MVTILARRRNRSYFILTKGSLTISTTDKVVIKALRIKTMV